VSPFSSLIKTPHLTAPAQRRSREIGPDALSLAWDLLERGVLPRLTPLENEASAVWLARTLSRVLPSHEGLQAGLSVWNAHTRSRDPELVLTVFREGPVLPLNIGRLFRALEARSPPLAHSVFLALHSGLLTPSFGPRETLWHFQSAHWNGPSEAGAVERYRQELEDEGVQAGQLETLVREFERTLVTTADLALESPVALAQLNPHAPPLSLEVLKSWCNPLFSSNDALKAHTRKTLELLEALGAGCEPLDHASRVDRSEANFTHLWQFGNEAPLAWEALYEFEEAYGGEVYDLLALPLPAPNFEKSLATLRLALGLQRELLLHLERYASDSTPDLSPNTAPLPCEDDMPWTEPTPEHHSELSLPALPTLPQALRELRAEVEAAHEISLEALKAWWFPPQTSQRATRPASARVCELLALLMTPAHSNETVGHAAQLPPM